MEIYYKQPKRHKMMKRGEDKNKQTNKNLCSAIQVFIYMSKRIPGASDAIFT